MSLLIPVSHPKRRWLRCPVSGIDEPFLRASLASLGGILYCLKSSRAFALSLQLPREYSPRLEAQTFAPKDSPRRRIFLCRRSGFRLCKLRLFMDSFLLWNHWINVTGPQRTHAQAHTLYIWPTLYFQFRLYLLLYAIGAKWI